MEIRIPCSKCGKVLIVPSEKVGQFGVCPACRHRFRIAPRANADTPDRMADTPPVDVGGTVGSATIDPPPASGVRPPNRSSGGTRRATPSTSKTPSDTFETGTENGPAVNPLAGEPPPETMTDPFLGVNPLAEQANATWFVRAPEGGQYGPATNAVMQSWIREGRVGVHSLVWRSGWTDWLPADRVFSNLIDAPPRQAPATSEAGSKTVSYLRKRRAPSRLRPIHYLVIVGAVISLIAIVIINFV
jgi:hypothetical protein